MSTVHSFPPLVAANPRCLLLGSMPGKASLAAQQYYAHPRNLFWPLMETLFGVDHTLPYTQRCQALTACGVALWDVLQACTRHSSLDADIVAASIVSNDFATFLARHPGIRVIGFNGGKAAAVFARHVAPQLPADAAAIPRLRLPSTSPANASIPLAEKRCAWMALRDRVTGSG